MNGHLYDELPDIGSRISVVFESWYRDYLSETTIHPVSKSAIWGLSYSSYPYLEYIVEDFQKKVTGEPTTMLVLALIYPDPPDPDQAPVIIGTNATLTVVQNVMLRATYHIFICLEEKRNLGQNQRKEQSPLFLSC